MPAETCRSQPPSSPPRTRRKGLPRRWRDCCNSRAHRRADYGIREMRRISTYSQNRLCQNCVKTPCIPGCGGIFERKEDDVLRENLVRARNAWISVQNTLLLPLPLQKIWPTPIVCANLSSHECASKYSDDSRLSDFTLVAGPFRCWRHG